MSVASTSILSYRSLDKVDLGKKQTAVLGFIRKYGPISNRELSEMTGWPINQITPRVNELRSMGLVCCDSEAYDDETNRIVNLWRVRA